jgi:hypothetical protein
VTKNIQAWPSPFLLPMCPCGGTTNLSHLQPAGAFNPDEMRTYRCSDCGAQISYPDRRASHADTGAASGG